MAITINQNPLNSLLQPITLSNGINILRANSTNVALPKFRFVVDVYIGGTTVNDRVLRIRRSPNQNNVLIISFQEIFRSYVSPDNLDSVLGQDISYSLPDAAQYFSNSINSTSFCRVEVGEEYASSATADPVIDPLSFVGGSGVIQLGGLQFLQGITYKALEFTLENVFNSSRGRMLTNAPKNEYFADLNQPITSSFLCYTKGFGTTVDFNVLQIIYYDANDNVISDNTYDLLIDMGAPATPSTVDPLNPNDINLVVQTLAIGPYNLEKGDIAAIRPSSNANWSYYTFQFKENALNASQVYRVTRVEECIYKPVRLRFLNEYGVWDYFTFYLQDKPKYNIEQKDFKKLYGSWNGASYGYTPNERGAAIYDSKYEEEHQAFSDYISEERSDWLKSLFSSREVYWLRDDLDFDGDTSNWGVAIYITNNSFTPKKRVNDNLIKHNITFRLANKNVTA